MCDVIPIEKMIFVSDLTYTLIWNSSLVYRILEDTVQYNELGKMSLQEHL